MKLGTAATVALLVWSAGANAQDMKAEVIHWWTSGGESAAVKVFADQFKKAGGVWIDSAVAGGVNARTAAINRTLGGNPPTAMQFNTGKQFDELVEGNLLTDVEAVASENKWRSFMPEAIVRATVRNGKMFAVPVNIHGQNWLFFNKAVLEKAGAAEPTNWTDVFVTLDKVKAAGLIPLAFSGVKVWERNLFNAVLVGQGGPEMFERIYGKQDAALAASAEFKAVAETYAKLRGYVDSGSPGRNWNDATTLVIQGKAGMQVMGDWARGEFAAAGMTGVKDFGCMIGLNEDKPVVSTDGDIILFFKQDDPEVEAAQKRLAALLISPAVQVAFNNAKGSMPVRADVDMSTADPCMQKALKAVDDPAKIVTATNRFITENTNQQINELISQFFADDSITPEDATSRFSTIIGNSD